MRVIGLVGGIGSGKSTAVAELAALGATVISADRVGHEVYLPGTQGFGEVVAEFGPEIVAGDGQIDRAKLGAIVFAAPERLARLNAILHPRIRDEIARRIEALRVEGRVPAVAVEAAILLEAGWRSLVDEVWVISADRTTVVERLVRDRGMSAADVEARMARQWSDAERRAHADIVIENSATLAELRDAIRRAWNERALR